MIHLNTKLRVLVSFVFLTGIAIPDLIAIARDGKAGEPLPQTISSQNKKQDQPPVQITEDAVNLFLQKIEIFGRIEKPQTVFIIPGKDPKIDDISIDRNFFKEIFRPVEKSTTKRKGIKETTEPHIPW